MHQTLYSKSTGTGITKQQNVSLQIPLPDSMNGFYSSQITTTDSVPNKLNENTKLNFLSENKTTIIQKKIFFYYYTTENIQLNRIEKTTKTLKLETEKYRIPDSNDLNYRTHKNQVKLIRLQGEIIKL